MSACDIQSTPTHRILATPPGLTPHAQQQPQQQPASDPRHTFDFNMQLRELLEQEILDFGEVIQAKMITTAGYTPPNLNNLLQSDDQTRGQEILNLLLAMGYSPHSDRPYEVMGFAELDGPELTEHTLTRRLQFADRHLKHSTTTNSHDTCNELLSKIHLAHERCLHLLPDIKEKRKLIKGIPRGMDHWRELHQECLSFLSTFVPKDSGGNSILATQLSNILRQDLTHIPNLTGIQDTRDLCNKLNGPANIIHSTLSVLTKPITIWAPEGQHQVLRLAACYRELLAKSQGPSSLTLIFAMDLYPGCTLPQHITDIWSHPLLGNKWADIVSNTTFLQPPTLMIMAGKNSPIHARKCLALITLGHNTPTLTPPTPTQILAWQPNFYEVRTHNTIWVDVPHEHRWHIHSLISTFKLPGLTHADRPRPSPGHRAEAPRSTIHIHFDNAMGSELMQNVIVNWLTKTLQVYQPLIGLQSTITNPTARMLDITSPTGAYLVSHLCDNIILITPRLAIITTPSTSAAWTQLMTHCWHNDPTHCALTLRLRESTNARNKKLAEVTATKEQMSAARARKGHQEIPPNPDKPLTLRATLDFPSNTDANSTSWPPHMMAHLSTTTRIPMQQHLPENGMELGTWKPLLNFEQNWTGKILLQCRTAEELLLIYKTVQNKGVNIQGHMTSIQMHSDYVDLEAHNMHNL